MNTAILLGFVVLFFASPVEVSALIDAHLNYDGCLTCHNLHGAPSQGSLLAALNSETTCLSCHGPLNPFGITEAAIHDPLGYGQGNMGYITCRECHNPHDNIGSNIKLIGYAFDPETGRKDGDGQLPALVAPAIREELSTSDINSPVYRTVTFANNADFNIDGTFPGAGVCQICHSPNHNIGADCSGCHPHDTGFKPKACTSTGCHDGLGAGALSIDNDSSHSFVATGYTCEECHSGHSSGTIEIPNNTTVGINYGSNGESGIALGSATATGSTEADICWNCHASHGVSEWNDNFGNSYNGYTITGGSDWTVVSFDGPGRVPNRPVVSIHSANDIDTESPAPTTAGIGANATVRSSSVGNNWNSTNGVVDFAGMLEDVSAIRCSYCHDVHDLNALASDNTSGKPYLRGSWLPNPYPLERPPQSGDSYTGNTFGQNVNFPRLLTDTNGATAGVGNANAVGGYQIDQNNNYPTSGETLASSAGLCELCHGSITDNFDYYSNASNATRLWVGPNNGHANSTIGGSGPLNGNNIFNAHHGGPPYSMATQNGVGVNNFGKANGEYMKSSGLYSTWRSAQPGKGNSTPPPKNTGWYGGFVLSDTKGDEYNNWYANLIGSMSGDTRAHNFSCSKCHTPHASGLPALLITNCLDRSISNWSASLTGGGTIGPAQTTGVKNSVQNNCHRKEGSYDSGWIRLAPGT